MFSVKQFDGNDNDSKDKHVKREKLLYELKIQKEYLLDNQIEKIESQIKHLIQQINKTNDKEKEQIMKIEEKVENNEKVQKEREINEFHAILRQIIEDAINELKRRREKSRKIKGAGGRCRLVSKTRKKNEKTTREVEVEVENESTC